MVVQAITIGEAQKLIQRQKKEKQLVVVQARDPVFNRKIVENKDVDILLSPELHTRKDALKQTDSGLNEVLAKIAAHHNISIGIDIGAIAGLSHHEKAFVLARIMQNIVVCRRTKTRIVSYPRRFTKQDVSSFFLALGGSTQQARDAFF